MIRPLALYLVFVAPASLFAQEDRSPRLRIETVAGSGQTELEKRSGKSSEVPIAQPFGVEVAPDGSLFVTEVGHHRVFRVDLQSRTTTCVAGTGEKGARGDGGPATQADLDEPYEIRFDKRGDFYVVEMRGARVRKVDAKTGTITTIAGTGEEGYAGDGGPANRAQLRRPHSIALDGKGSLYIADIGNHRIRRVDLTSGRIATIAGNGEKKLPLDGSLATGKPMLGPRALHIVGTTLWIALREGHSVWRMDLETRRLTHVAGSGRKGYRDGAGKTAMFNGPKGVVASADNKKVWVVDTENQCIREIDVVTSTVRTVAGSGPKARGYGGDGGDPLKAKMDRPHGIAVDSEGRLYIGDTNNHRVRRVAPAAPTQAHARPWSQFLGPERNGISRETGLNLRWTRRKPKVLWRRPLGRGFSSISCDGERVFTMASRSERDVIVAFDAARGKPLWAVDTGPTFHDYQGQGEGPRATPTWHDGKLLCLMPAGDLLCLDAASGESLWKTNVFEAIGASNHRGENFYWGLSASPLVEGDLVIVQPGGPKGGSVAAFRRDDGQLAWKTGGDPVGYGSPIAIDAAGVRQVIVTTGRSLLSLEPLSGRTYWRHEWGNSVNCNCATPLTVGDALFISSSYGTGCALLDLTGGDGAAPSVKQRWKTGDLQNHYSTSIVIAGNAYGCHANQASTLRCIDLRTGKRRWASRSAGKCSLIAVQDHLICLSERGVITLVAADPRGFAARGQVKGLFKTRKAWAPPALSGGRLYVRDDQQIVCLDLRTREP